MKKTTILLIAIASTCAFAQRGQNQSGLNYDVNLEETHSGIIESSNIGTGMRNGQFTFTTDQSLELNLTFGPPRFFSQLGVTLETGTALTITGMPYVNASDVNVFIIRKFTSNGQTYEVRDETGQPLWIGTKGNRRSSRNNGRRGSRGQRGSSQGNCMLQYLATTPMEEVSDLEANALTQLREEEKLARDVYLFLAENSSLRVFSNIARAEQQHMDSIGVLLDRYDLNDPITDDTPGVFSTEEFTSLYSTLIQAGSTSQNAALQVGATIEDLDIYDLIEGLNVCDNTDIKMVFQNLMKGSRNHLRSFGGLLLREDTPYSAQYLTQTEVDEIITSPKERGIVLDADGQPLEGCSNHRNGNGRRNHN
jgi:hypothetical protein